ncbi:MAG: N-acetylmuramoyl-L-alanine amidase, partial [Desulfobacterota bacterium]|nr:N-acetylmuramoyl-L-alanine amidase [Thermodesulfobacteriota bacterium]
YQSFFLNDPQRFVLDLKNTTDSFPFQDIVVNEGVVSKIRFGKFDKNTFRIVFDLVQPIEAKIFWAESGSDKKYQLVIELSRKNFTNEPNKNSVSSSPELSPKKVVVIDPGHGGEDPGAIGLGGSLEKHLTLEFARTLKKVFDESGNYETFLTRNGDYFLPLKERIKLAEIKHADLFISIHADSNHNRYTQGASVYCLSLRGATDEAARCLAEKENEADLIAGIPLTENDNLNLTLLDLALTQNINLSLRYGALVIREIAKVHGVKFEQPKQAGFRVLKTAEVPSILVELGFISNPQEELILKQKDFQARVAQAILSASEQFRAFLSREQPLYQVLNPAGVR